MARLVTVSIDGLRELDQALGQLTKATARNVVKRVLVKAGAPIAEAASHMAPKDTGELSSSVVVSSKVQNSVGKAEYAEAMRQGLGKDAALKALRGARRSAKGKDSFGVVLVGPTQAKTKKDAIKRIVQEFGSVNQPGQPYMRPAWDQNKDKALDIITGELGGEIQKAAARAAKRAALKARKAVKK